MLVTDLGPNPQPQAAKIRAMAQESMGPESTATLLSHCRGGSQDARDRLVTRFLPILRRWAHGRLPASGRTLAATDDLVQVTLIRALDSIERFDARGEGAFLAYLRQILLNQIRDELRRSARQPQNEVMESDAALIDMRSPADSAINDQTLEAYEIALAELAPTDREAVLMRLEFGYSYKEIAADLGLPSPNAARMRIVRAVETLAENIDVEQLR